MTPKEYKQMMTYLTRPSKARGPRNMQLAKANDIPDAFNSDLEQTEVLRPGETLETWEPNPFLKPHAEGGRIGFAGGHGVGASKQKLDQVIGAYRRYRKGEKNPKLNFKRFFEIYAKENFADGGRAGYNAGQLVTPSIDGSRPGYSGLTKTVLQNIIKKKIPGITYYPPGYPGKTAENTIAFLTRTTDKTGKRTSKTKTFNIDKATEKEINAYLNQEKKSLEGKVQVKGGDVNIVRANYTEAKKGFTNELINWLETNAHNSKYKNPEQLLAAAKKVFNKPKYTEVPAKVEKSKAFFTKEKGFVLPKEFEFYGKMIDTKNPAKVHNDMAMIALLKSNNPNFEGKKETLMKYYNRDPKSPKPKLSKEEDTFLKNFSKTYIRSGFGEKGVAGGASEGSVMIRFLKKEGANFKNKLNNWNEVRRLETDIRKELALEGLSPNRIAFLNRTLKATENKRKTISEALRKDYSDLFTGKKGDITGALVQEHKVARAIGETSESFIPGTYLARSEFTPAAFNLQKLKDFDTPFMSLVEKYNKAVPKDRPGIIKEIKELKAEFNKASGGYLKDVDITFGTKTVKIKDKTPYLFDVSKEDTYKQILKNIKHSNTYFKNKGMDNYVLTGNSFNKFQRDLKNRIASSEKGSADMRSLLATLGIGGTSSVFAYNFLPSSAKAAEAQAAEAQAAEPGAVAKKSIYETITNPFGLSPKDRAKILGTAVAGDWLIPQSSGALTKASMKGLWKTLPFIWTPMGDAAIGAYSRFSKTEPKLEDFAEGFKEAGYDINSEEFQKQWNSIPEDERKEILYTAAGQVIDKRSMGEKVLEKAESPWTHAQYAFWKSGVESMQKLLAANPGDSVLKNKLKQHALLGIRMGVPMQALKIISPIGWSLTAGTVGYKTKKWADENLQWKPLTEEQRTDIQERQTAMPRMLDKYEQVSQRAKEQGISYEEALKQFDTTNVPGINFIDLSLLPKPVENPGAKLMRDHGLFGSGFAGGGIAKLAGVSSGPPPESGPNSQGLPGLLKRVRNL
jgi:hypothetical protein